MITPEIPESFALLNYKKASFIVDTVDEAIAALKSAAKELTGFNYKMSFTKSAFRDKYFLSTNSDPKHFDRLFSNRITLHPVDGKQILSIQLRDNNSPIVYAMDLTSEIYRQLQMEEYAKFE
jgi:hypothetical protein